LRLSTHPRLSQFEVLVWPIGGDDLTEVCTPNRNEGSSGNISFTEKQPEFGTVPWANAQTRWAIAQIRSAALKTESSWKNSLLLVLFVKDRLRDLGFSWQAKVIDHWIHKAMAQRRDAGLFWDRKGLEWRPVGRS
jgi:hypothetical protein